MNKSLYISGAAICSADETALRTFAVTGIDVDKTLLPAALRRRTGLTTKMAVTAAAQACTQAQVDTTDLASVFASVGGEIQVTDALCRTLPDMDALLSPTQFHNSVHNTTAGYWSILNHCQAPTTAIAAGDDTFAMGLLEAWVQLQQTPGDLLLVCYDELWPQYLAPPMGRSAFACALILSTDSRNSQSVIGVPEIVAEQPALQPELLQYIHSAPAAAVIPLFQALQRPPGNYQVPLNMNEPYWYTFLQNA
jgi:beta-ketoacyl synthase-like protein